MYKHSVHVPQWQNTNDLPDNKEELLGAACMFTYKSVYVNIRVQLNTRQTASSHGTCRGIMSCTVGD